MPRGDHTEIHKLAADPEIVNFIKAIERFFHSLSTEAYPALGGKTPEERIEDYWLMLKQGTLRTYDPDIDDGGAIVMEAVTPRQQARARIMGTKLFAIRQAHPPLAKCKNGASPNPTHQSGPWNADTSLALTKS